MIAWQPSCCGQHQTATVHMHDGSLVALARDADADECSVVHTAPGVGLVSSLVDGGFGRYSVAEIEARLAAL